MKFTEEQKKELIDGFRRHDITQTVHLRGDFENKEKKKNKKKPKKEPKENPLKMRVLKYMESDLRDFGFKRYIRNFSEKNPINLLMDADATYISDEAMKLLADEKQTADAVEQYMELFWPLIEHAIESYCTEKGKEPEDITDEELRRILDRTTTVVNEELLSAVMQGQQFDEISKITHESHAHEDFKNDSLWVSNTDAINFFNQWTHSDTKIGAMLSLDDDSLRNVSTGFDPLEKIKIDKFRELLDDVDDTILLLRERKYTQAEIAEELGYKTHSAVTKRIEKMRLLWIAFDREYESNN